jgi:hypothetical protein
VEEPRFEARPVEEPRFETPPPREEPVEPPPPQVASTESPTVEWDVLPTRPSRSARSGRRPRRRSLFARSRPRLAAHLRGLGGGRGAAGQAARARGLPRRRCAPRAPGAERRVRRRRGAPGARATSSARADASAAAPRSGDRVPRSRRRRQGRVLGVIALGLIGIAGWLLVSLFQPFAGEGDGQVRVTVPSGSTSADVGDQLEKAGVVSSSFFFTMRARLDGTELKAGSTRSRRACRTRPRSTPSTPAPPRRRRCA